MTARPAARAQFLLLCGHALLFQAAIFLLRPTVSYRALELGVGSAWLGVLAGGFAFAPLLIALPAGSAADRYGERRILLGGVALVGVACAVFLAAGDSFMVLVVGTVVLGTAHLLCMIGQQSLVSNLIPRGKLDSAFGHYTFASSLGQVLGPALLSMFGSGGTMPRTKEAFLAAAAVAALLAILTGFLRSAITTRSRSRSAGPRLAPLLRTRGVMRALLVSSIVVAAMDIVLVYLPALGIEAGLTVGTVALLLAMRSLSSMVSRFFLGTLTGRWGRRLVLLGSVGGAGVGMAVVGFTPSMPILAVAVVVMGLGLGICQPLTLSWLAEISPPGLRGRVVSVRIVGNRLGQVIFPGTVGLVATGLGAAGVLWMTSVALVGVAGVARSVPMDAEPDGAGEET